MKLRPVKLTKDTQCTKCKHDLKANWDAYANDTNEVYCRFCAPKADEPTSPVQLETLNILKSLYQQGRITGKGDGTGDSDLPF